MNNESEPVKKHKKLGPRNSFLASAVFTGIFALIGSISEKKGLGVLSGTAAALFLIMAACTVFFLVKWMFILRLQIKLRKINFLYLLLALIILIPAGYFGFRQFTVKSCYSSARNDFKEAKGKFKQEKGYEPRLTPSEEAFSVESRYITCMRDKGFSE